MNTEVVMSSPKPSLYPIKGGIGKCVLFTSLIDPLVARTGSKIAVACGFPGVFAFHPQVAMTMKGITPEAITPVADKFEDIVMREPYVSNYCKGDRHILDEWARLYGLEPLEKGGFHSRPDLVLGETFIRQSDSINAQLKRPFIIVQWTGGQPPNNFKNKNKYPDNYLTQARNVRNYQDIMSALGEAYPEHLFLIYALPNEPVEMPVHLKSRIARARAPALAYAALLKHADSFVALDSSLQHFGAAQQIGKKGVVLWGQKTTPETIGYSFHTNLNSTVEGQVVVPPADVVTALNKIIRSN